MNYVLSYFLTSLQGVKILYVVIDLLFLCGGIAMCHQVLGIFVQFLFSHYKSNTHFLQKMLKI